MSGESFQNRPSPAKRINFLVTITLSHTFIKGEYIYIFYMALLGKYKAILLSRIAQQWSVAW